MKTFRLVEATLSAADRNSLRSNQFGLPEERKFPLNDASHVRSAISRFHFCPAGKRHQLAKKIASAARRYGVEIGDDSPIKKYLKEGSTTRYTLTEADEKKDDSKTKYEVLDNVPPELKDALEKFFRERGLAPNHYYPEDKSNNQAIQRYLGIDERNWSCRSVAVKADGEIVALLDAIPLSINGGTLEAYAAYVYGAPTDDSKTNQKMIETLLKNAMNNPDQSIKWLVFNDLSRHSDKRWINELEKFGFIQPYRFNTPAYKDTMVLVHVIRSSAGHYPITYETDVRNAEENLPENQAVE